MRHWWLSALLLVAFLATEAEARILRVYLTPDLEEVDVPVSVGDSVAWHLPEPVVLWDMGNKRHYEPELSESRFVFAVEPSPSAPPTTLHLKLWNHFLTCRVRLAESHEEPVSRVEVIDPRRPSANQEEIEGEWVDSARHAQLSLMIDGAKTSAPVTRRWQSGEHILVVRFGAVSWGGEFMVFRFEIDNQGELLFPISTMEIRDTDGQKQGADFLIQDIARSTDLEVARDSILVGAVRVKTKAKLQKGFSLYLSTPSGVAPATFNWGEEGPRGPLEDRLALTMRVLGGTTKLDGVGDDARWTAMRVFGVQALYGVWKHISIEATLDFSQTTTATFNNTMWDGMSGDLDVTEMSGRLMAGGLLHTGKRWLPYARLAVGARFSRHAMSMADRVDSEIRSGAIFSFGGGMNVMLSKRLVAGVSFSYNAPLGGGDDTSTTAEAGAHIGALWDIGDDW